MAPDFPRKRNRTLDPSIRACRSSHRRQAERSVDACVLLVADTDQAQLEQSHDRREHLVSRQALRGQVLPAAPPDPGQRSRERDHPLEVLGTAPLAPLRVIAVLLPTACVATRRLEMAVRPRADPDIGPGGWDGESRDPRAGVRIPDRGALSVEVGPAATGPAPSPTGPGVGRMAQSAGARCRAGVVRRHRHGGTVVAHGVTTGPLRDLRHMPAISHPDGTDPPIGSRSDTATSPVATG